MFVYKLLWQLLTFYQLAPCAPDSSSASRKRVDQCILLLRLEGHCSLESISQSIRQLGLPFSSVGYISQRLTDYAQTGPKDVLTGARIVFLLCDEIFTLGQPILLTVAPRSLAILKIELAEQRDAETWQKPWRALAAAGLLTHQTVVSDQGPGLVKGGELRGLTHHPDLFHLLRPLAMFGERFYRQALAAIAWEYERGRGASGRSEPVINKRREAYEAAKAAAEEQIRRYDDFCYLWAALRQELALFDSEGKINDLVSRQAEIEAILALMRELGCAKLKQESKSFAAGLEGYWGYYQRAKAVYQQLLARYPHAVVQALACGWQVQKHATNNKDYGSRKRLTQEAECYFD